MPSEPGNAATPFSIFISYASADRPQARLLGETLTKAGLDVWFDEEELAGGESWDAKIRQQIRTCTYFMPVISATTEARREGYFRREWRLAVERTLDLADDVTFLVPVVIDSTPEYQARVPEKFTSVQWLRCPGGQETPQLLALARRLAADPAVTVPPPPSTAVPARPALSPKLPAVPPAAKDAAASAGLAPFPVFPAFPERGHRTRFLYDLIVWAGHMIRALWVRLPRWLRLVATVLIVFKVINLAFHVSSSSDDEKPPTATATKVAKAITQAEDDSDNAIAEKIIRAAGTAIDSFQSGRPLAVIAFAATEKPLEPVAQSVFNAMHTGLNDAGHGSEISLGAMALPAGYTDTEVFARGAVLKCHWLFAGTARPADSDHCALAVKLYDITAQKVIWQTEHTILRADAEAAGRTLAAELLQQVPLDTASTKAPPATPQPATK